MSVLNAKLRRELLGGAGALSTVVAIIAVGTGSFIGLGSAQRILEASQQDYYRQYRFADFWVDVKKAPLTAVAPLADLPGVATIESRVVFDVILDLPTASQPIRGRLISTPKRDARTPAGSLNDVCLVRGSFFCDDRDEEVIVGDAFAQAHGLEPGDRIGLILNRKRESFRVVGTAISPEYVYMVSGQGDFFPDPKHFGILYLKERYAREVLDFKDACNQVVGRVIPGTQQNLELLLDRIARRLEPYGVLGTTPRERQASHRFLSDEIKGLGVTAIAIPSIFLLVAALVLNILMSRMAERQRTVIGMLKAVGYTNGQVIGHFLGFGVVVGIVGGLAGIGVGLAMTYGLVQVYPDFFQFPAFAFRMYPDLLGAGMLISVLFAVAGGARGAWSVLKLEPAESMREKPPTRGGAVVLEKFPWLWRRMSFRTHIALRSVLRNRARSLTCVLSLAMATALILMTLMMYDSIWFLVDFQFDFVARSDVDIGMRDAGSQAALFESRNLPGVDYGEPVLGMVCDVRHGRHSRRLAVMGLSREHRLTTPRQRDLTPIDIPPHGLVMSRKLASILGLEVGHTLELTPVRGRRWTRQVPLVSVVDGFIGLECYADIQYLSRVLGEPTALNSVQLSVNPFEAERLHRAVKRLPNAQGFNVRADARAALESTFVESMSASLALTVLFAGVIAFGSILNSSLAEIADRRRDIATFRVIGYQPAQIAGIFFRQNMIVFVAGLILAVPLGCWISSGLVRMYDTELFRMPVVVKWSTILWTGMIACSFVLIAQWFVYRQIVKLDWLEAVKAKE